MRIGLSAALLAVACFCSGPTASFSAGSSGLSDVLLQPSDQSGNTISEPGYYRIILGPGQTDQLYALVGNTKTTAETIRVSAVDAKSGVYGGVSYNLPQQRRSRVGAWVGLSRAQVRLPSQRGTTVAFSVRVPPKTRPGQYVGGLTAYPAIPKTVIKKKGHSSEALALVFRRVLAIVVTVPGAVRARFKISHVRPVARPDSVYLIARIRNAGGLLLAGSGHLWLWRQGYGKPVRSVNIRVGTTVPRTSVAYPIRWRKHPPRGTYSYSISLHWHGGRTKLHGTFVVR